MRAMTHSNPSPGTFRVSALSPNRPTGFDLRPDAETRKAYAEEIGISAIRKLSFRGDIVPAGKDGWRLEGTLGATVVQPCVVTLAPVATRIDEQVTRRYLPAAQIDTPEPGSEIEMPEDDTVEPLGDTISPQAVMIEALVLTLPLYPRAEEAALGEAVYTEEGAEPLRDSDLKPFSGLAGLRDKLDKDG